MTKALKSLNPVSRSRLHEDIVGQIQKKIISGELSVGGRLPAERELAATFDVNRSTVREAVKKLEFLGLVEIRHGDGIYVKNYLESGNLELLKTLLYMDEAVDVGILSNLLEMRRLLAPLMAALAAEYCTEAHCEELEAIIENSEMSMLEKDLKVHHLVARACNNLLYIFILNFFNQAFRDYGYLYFEEEKNVKVSGDFHRNMLSAMKKKDSKKAEKIMNEVMLYSEKRTFQKYREIAGFNEE